MKFAERIRELTERCYKHDFIPVMNPRPYLDEQPQITVNHIDEPDGFNGTTIFTISVPPDSAVAQFYDQHGYSDIQFVIRGQLESELLVEELLHLVCRIDAAQLRSSDTEEEHGQVLAGVFTHMYTRHQERLLAHEQKQSVRS